MANGGRLFTVIWHYISNYGIIEVYGAKDAKDTLRVFEHSSDDFKAKARIMVFEGTIAYDSSIHNAKGSVYLEE